MVETERLWDYLEASEQKYRPTLVPSPNNPDRQNWFLNGEDLGFKFPSPDKKQSEEHLKRYGREVETPVGARELSDVERHLQHMDDLGIDIQVLYNSLWLTPLTTRPDAEIALCWSWNRWLADIWKLGEDRLRWTCVVPALTPKEAISQIRFAKDYVSTQTDDDFAYIISYAGEDNLLIGTDYGHGDTSSELNAIARFKAIEGLSEAVKRKILSENPRRFYRL